MKMIRNVLVLVVVISLAAQPVTGFAATDPWRYNNSNFVSVQPGQIIKGIKYVDPWSYDDSILVNVKPEQIVEGKKYVPSDFPEVDASRVVIFKKSHDVLELIIVLNSIDEEKLPSAIEALSKNPLVESATNNKFLPYQSSATLNMTEATVKVGDEITLECVSSDLSGQGGFKDNLVVVGLKDYDETKVYTPADFPEYDISEVRLDILEHGENKLELVLKNPGYYNLCNTIDALSKDANVNYVSYVIYPGGALPECNWSVSDTSIATVESRDAGFYKNGVVTALKPGKTTVTLEVGYHDNNKAYVTCELTVTEAPTKEETTTDEEPTTSTEKEETAKPVIEDSKISPKTGDTAYSVLIIALAAVSVMTILIGNRRKCESK